MLSWENWSMLRLILSSPIISSNSNRGGDAITIDGATKIWIDHCTTSLIGRQHIVLGFEANQGWDFLSKERFLRKDKSSLKEAESKKRKRSDENPSSSTFRLSVDIGWLSTNFGWYTFFFSNCLESLSAIIISTESLPILLLGESDLSIKVLLYSFTPVDSAWNLFAFFSLSSPSHLSSLISLPLSVMEDITGRS